MPLSQVVCEFRPCGQLRSCGHPCVNKCSQPCDEGSCVTCQSDLEHRLKKSQQRAKARIKNLRQQIEETGSAFTRTVLDREVNSAEYLKVFDMVTKYVLPMHNWYPQITKIEKVHNLELEAQYEEYRSVAFGELEDLKFHGTSDEGVEGITRDGFRIGKPGMYGAGIYFATDSSKSSQAIYTKGSNKLLLCKVFLGQAKTVSKADSSLTGESLRAEGFDSVFAPRGTKGSGGVVNDEFVIFDTRQAVVQYVIHYCSTSDGLPGVAQLATTAGNVFRKVRLTPGRSVNLNDPLEATYRYAEGHFNRMFNRMMLHKGQLTVQKTISAITVLINTKLAANFERMRTKFTAEKKGELQLQ